MSDKIELRGEVVTLRKSNVVDEADTFVAFEVPRRLLEYNVKIIQ